MQNTDIQTMDTTANKLEVYSDSIEESISNYCIDHNLKTEDLYKIDQSRWNSVLLYVYKQVFKPTPDNNPNYRYNGKSNIDYNFCYEYSKEVSIMGFSKLTGINVDTIYEWLNEDTVERGSSEVAKKLKAEREESLSVRLVSGKGNPVGILGILNRHYGWNMGQPRGQEQRQTAPSIPDMARKYGIDQADQRQIPKFPEVKETDN